MNSISGTFDLDMRLPVSERIAEITEDLWQKGYDLKKAGMGWVLREPLGTQKIELASDHELLEFVGGGYKLAMDDHGSDRRAEPRRETPPPAASFAASPPPVRQASPRLKTPPQLVDLPHEPLSLRRLAQDTWQEFFPARFRYWIALVLAIPFVLIMAAEGFRWYNQTSDASRSEAKAVVTKAQADVNVTPTILTAPQDTLVSVDPRPSVATLSNNTRFMEQTQPAVPLKVLPVKASKLANPQDLTLFADQCAIHLMERFASGPLALMINAQARRATVCYLVDGKTHCPYVSQGRATLNYLDVESNPPNVYACDIDVSANALGNLRLIESNPDIVRFLTGDGAS